jgi:hypothetical protein
MIGPDDMNQDPMTRLALLDPAPPAAPDPAEHARREEMLQRILADPRPSRAITRGARRARGPVRRLALTGGTILAAAVIAVALVAGLTLDRADRAGSGGLTGAELASWTGAPHRLDVHSATGRAGEHWCLGQLTSAPAADRAATITNADIRGQVASLVISRAGYSFLCLTGGDGTGLWETIADPDTPVATPGARQIILDSAGSHGDGRTGYTYVEGLAGRDVTAVTIHDAGQVITATLQGGRWTAWWPTADPHGAITGYVVITTDRGRMTISGNSLMH